MNSYYLIFTLHLNFIFMVGGTAEDGCQKKLNLDGYTDHANEPYCNGCYRKLFGPKVYLGGSATLQSDTTVAGEDVIKNDRFFKVSAVDPYLLNPLGELARIKAEEEAKIAAEKEAAAAALEAAAKAAAEAKAKKVTTPTTPKATIATTCAKCSGNVSMGDRRTGCSKLWHTDCFTCGGVTPDGCGKRLAADQFMSLNANPFCKACYAKVSTSSKRPIVSTEQQTESVNVASESAPSPVSVPITHSLPPPPDEAVQEPEVVIDTSAFDEEKVEEHEILAMNSAMSNISIMETKPLEALNMTEMANLLKNLSMDKYVSQFVDNDISGKILAEVSTEDELRECEIDLPGPISRAFMNFLFESKNTGVKTSLLG